MIVHPANWRQAGQPVSIGQLEDTLKAILSHIPCACLSFSGGLDSSLLLYFMLALGRKVDTFTIANDEAHPDIKYAKLVIAALEEKFGVKINSHWRVVRTGVLGDDLVKVFYDGLQQWTPCVIAGDGVDEYMAGYYTHQRFPHELEYYSRLRRLQSEHLAPLHKNSGKVKVYLPFLDSRFVSLMAQIPIEDKVDAKTRKKVMAQLAEGKLPPEVIDRRKYGFGTSGR